MSDQDRISPYNINQTDDENEEKYKFEDFLVDPVPNSQNCIVRIVWQTVRRITNEIMAIEGLNYLPQKCLSAEW